MALTEACIALDWIDDMDLVGFFSDAGFGLVGLDAGSMEGMGWFGL